MLSKQSKFILFVLILTIAVSVFSVSCYGAIHFSKDNLGDENSLFVAGNPDLYPIEYYNRLTGKYEGLLPQLYEEISAKTGINFTYI